MWNACEHDEDVQESRSEAGDTASFFSFSQFMCTIFELLNKLNKHLFIHRQNLDSSLSFLIALLRINVSSVVGNFGPLIKHSLLIITHEAHINKACLEI